MLNKADLVFPDWPVPANVKSIQTTRCGGFSVAPYDTLNLGSHVQDNPVIVAQNRQLLSRYLPSEPVWLNQVHGVEVVDASQCACTPDADASFTHQKEVVCVTMTADCLPILLCDRQGTVVAAVHAGWRSLCDGVIEATVKKMQASPVDLMAWLGAAIGPQAFEVGDEVSVAFITKDAQSDVAFTPRGDKWLGDLYLVAKQRLANLGVHAVYGGGECTYSQPEKYFSFRRDGVTGRMASLIWLD